MMAEEETRTYVWCCSGLRTKRSWFGLMLAYLTYSKVDGHPLSD